jgi:hypothetical protein
MPLNSTAIGVPPMTSQPSCLLCKFGHGRGYGARVTHCVPTAG